MRFADDTSLLILCNHIWLHNLQSAINTRKLAKCSCNQASFVFFDVTIFVEFYFKYTFTIDGLMIFWQSLQCPSLIFLHRMQLIVNCSNSLILFDTTSTQNSGHNKAKIGWNIAVPRWLFLVDFVSIHFFNIART